MSYRSTIQTKRWSPLSTGCPSGDGTLLSRKNGTRWENQAPKPARRDATRRKGKAARQGNFDRIDMAQLLVEIREYEADLLSLQEEEDDFHASLLYGKEMREAVATEVSMGGASEDHTEAAASVDAATVAAVAAATSTDDDEDDDDADDDDDGEDDIELVYCWSNDADVKCALFVDGADYDEDDDDVVIAEEMEDVHYGISMCMGF